MGGHPLHIPAHVCLQSSTTSGCLTEGGNQLADSLQAAVVVAACLPHKISTLSRESRCSQVLSDHPEEETRVTMIRSSTPVSPHRNLRLLYLLGNQNKPKYVTGGRLSRLQRYRTCREFPGEPQVGIKRSIGLESSFDKGWTTSLCSSVSGR